MSNLTQTANRKKKKKNLSATQGKGGGGGELGGGTPKNHWRGCAAGSPNPDPISDQNMAFSTPVFRPDL